MSTEITIAIIASISSIVGGIITALMNNRIIEYRIKIVEKEVETLDNLASRVLAVEIRLASLDEKITEIREKINVK